MKMKKLNVLLSAYACNPSSSAKLHPGEDIKGWRFVEQISRFHNVWVISHSYNRNSIVAALYNNPLRGVEFIFVTLPRIFRLLYKVDFGQRIYYYLWQIKAWRVARKIHKKIPFNIFHHVSFGNDWMPSFIGALLPIPFVWGPLGGGQKTPRCLRREYSLYGRFAETMRSVAQFVGRKDYFRQKCLKKAKAILVCNQETRNLIPQKYSCRIHWFPLNGIFPSDLRKSPECFKRHSPFRVITAGRLHRLKGFGLAIRAFKLFAEKYPDVEFLIVGSGPERRRLERQISQFGLAAKVKIQPWAQRKDLLRLFCLSDVFLFPSFRDGGGAVVVEAMACGKSIVCLDVGGPGFHVQEQWGIKIEPKSVDYIVNQIVEALGALYKDNDRLIKKGKAAVERAEDYYLADRLGERLQKIYACSLDSRLS